MAAVKRTSRRILAVLALLATGLASGGGAASASYRGLNGQIVFDSGTDMKMMSTSGTIQRSYGMNATPQEWSPDGNRLLYTAGGYVWSMRADGSGKRRIARGFGGTWSPDGRWIAFHRNVGPHRLDVDVFRIRHDGTGLKRLTWTPGDTAGSFHPRWKPTGGTIAFIRDEGPASQIFLMGTDGTRKRRLTSYSDMRARTVDWAPNGYRLVAELKGPACYSGQPNNLSWIMYFDLQTGHRGATHACANLHNPTWSPDGRRVVMNVDFDPAKAHFGHDHKRQGIVIENYKGGSTYVRYGDYGRPIWRPLR